MIAIQNPWGHALIPYAVNLSERVFDVLNGLGLLFIPFIILFIVSFLEARAQGLDEGSPAVLAVKAVEKGFWSMVILLVLFVIPIEDGESNVSLTRYQCGMGVNESGLPSVYTIEPQLEQAGLALTDNKARLSLGIGFTNNITTGISETLSSQLPCGRTTSVIQSELDKSFIKINNEPLAQNLKLLGEACYSPAQTIIRTGILDGKSKIDDPYNVEGNYFFGENLRMAYGGVANTTPQSKLTLQIKDTEYAAPIQNEYKPANYEHDPSYISLKTDKLLIDCSDVATDMKEMLNQELFNNSAELNGMTTTQFHQSAVDRIYESDSVFPKADASGGTYNVTKEDIVNRYINQAFIDTVLGKRQIIEPENPLEDVDDSNWFKETFDSLFQVFDSGVGDTAQENLVSLGFMTSNFGKALERTNIYAIVPLYITVISAVVYIASPFLFLLAGLSWKMAANVIFLHFYLTMGYYILNVAYLMSDVLWMIADSAYGVSLHNSALALHYMAYASPIVALTVWTSICVIAGLNIGPFLVGLFTVNAVAAAKTGQRAATSAFSATSSGISKKQMGN